MLLEKEYFDIWMRRIMERLEAIEQRQKPPKAQEYPTLENGEKLFDNYDLCRMLHVSKRTLQRYRSKCGLKYRMLNQKAFYKSRTCSNSSATISSYSPGAVKTSVRSDWKPHAG